jgi:hypothetical protein
MNTTTTNSKNLFLKRIASHIGHSSINSKDFFSDCDNILGHGGANYFIYCSENKDFLKKNKELIKSKILDLFDSLGESPRTYNYTLYGKPLDEEYVVDILSFLYSSKIPKEQGTACDWLVWSAVETEIFNREEEISNRKWEK